MKFSIDVPQMFSDSDFAVLEPWCHEKIAAGVLIANFNIRFRTPLCVFRNLLSCTRLILGHLGHCIRHSGSAVSEHMGMVTYKASGFSLSYLCQGSR